MNNSEANPNDRDVMMNDVLFVGGLAMAAEVTLAGLRGEAEVDTLDVIASARSLRLLTDDAIAKLVRRARMEHQSWAAIGTALGTSRQAAFERYATDAEREPSTEEHAVRLPVASARGVARTFLDAFFTREFKTCHMLSDPQLARGLPEPVLATLLESIRQDLGEILEVRESRITPYGSMQIVDTPVVLSRGTRIVRVVVNQLGLAGGFFLLASKVDRPVDEGDE
ncbi:MAG: hypothetical protein ACP5HZ_07005 [Ferrimicrobium sp.]